MDSAPQQPQQAIIEYVDTVAVEARDTRSSRMYWNARWDGTCVPDRRLTGVASFQTFVQ